MVLDPHTAIGYGAQIGVFYDSGDVIKLGASYKTKQGVESFLEHKPMVY